MIQDDWRILPQMSFGTFEMQQTLKIAFGFSRPWNIILVIGIFQSNFLALLCATAQQSYCRHAGVRRPSVRRPSSVR